MTVMNHSKNETRILLVDNGPLIYQGLDSSASSFFILASMAFAVEIALAVARKDDSSIQIKNKQDLYQVLTNIETLYEILEQALHYLLSPCSDTCGEVSRSLCEQYQINKDKIVEYFMNIFARWTSCFNFVCISYHLSAL
jgi:hypothetical protein